MRIKILLAILVLTAIGLSAYYFYFQKNASFPNPSKKTLDLPVNPNQPGIYNIAVVYTFTGELKDVRKEGQNYILKLDQTVTENLPNLVATPQTVVEFFRNQEKLSATLTDLKVGQHVILPTAYYPKDKTWQLQAILIQE